jgi:hypothetical protein
MWQDYSSISTLAKSTFSINDEQLNWTYSIGLLCTLPLFVPVAHYLNGSTNFATMAMANIGNCIAAWMRYLAVAEHSYGWALASGAMLG